MTTLPLPTATDKGADTTFNNKLSYGSFGKEATIGASLETTTGPCTATGALFETTTGPCTATSATGAEGTPPSTVSFNVAPREQQTNSFPTGKPWHAEKKYR